MQCRVISRHQRTRLTYDALDGKSNALARGLLGRGVKKGDRVAVSLGNNIEYAIVRGLSTARECVTDSTGGYIWPIQDWGNTGETVLSLSSWNI